MRILLSVVVGYYVGDRKEFWTEATVEEVVVSKDEKVVTVLKAAIEKRRRAFVPDARPQVLSVSHSILP